MNKRSRQQKKSKKKSSQKIAAKQRSPARGDIKVWLDDWRQEPAGWVRCYTVGQVIRLLKQQFVGEMSLDHNLGDRLEPGVKVLDWLEEQAHFDPEFRIPKIHIHSANPYGRAIMIAIARRIRTRGRG